MSHNVIAKITGTKYPDEYVIYSAHWDHLGIGKPDAKGDSIYNGAADNASGTAERYHQPADQYDSTWDLTGGLQDIQLVYAIGQKLANSRAWPEWKSGSEFKAIRDKSAAERK